MSDNEDLLGDDLGDQSLADYNLGNEEEEQLLADDYESGGPQNVPVSLGDGFTEPVEMLPSDYSTHAMEFVPPQPVQYQPMVETECVVPNITVEVPTLPPHSTYAPVEPRHYEVEHAVPPAIPAGPMESPQIVPSELAVSNADAVRERFVAERPVGAQRMPQVRDIPDTLDKVVIPRGFPRGRTSWRSPHFNARYSHPYRRNNMHRGNFNQRHSFPPPQPVHRPNIPQQVIRQEIRPEIMRPEIRPEMIRPEVRQEMVRPDAPPEIIRPEIGRPEMIGPDMIRPEMMRPEIGHPEMVPMRPEIRPDLPAIPQMGPEISPERPILPEMFRPPVERPPFQPFPRFQFRPEERPMFGQIRPNFERPMYPYPRQPVFNPRFGPPMREIVANSSHMPQVTIRQVPDKLPVKEPEVRMLPVPLPPHIPPGGLAGKKVLINPHFKGNFQPPVEGLPAYIPTRIQKSPPLSPTNKFGGIKDIDDAAERFIAEQRNALARAAGRKFLRRSPQRYIENTTIEIENELAGGRPAVRPRRNSDDDLLRRQEEFINANRAGLRRRMRSPSPASPARRSPSPRRARPEAPRDTPTRPHDEESEYKRRVREQESLRERVLRAKELRRRRNAVALTRQGHDRERETLDKGVQSKDKENQPAAIKEPEPVDKPTSTDETKPDTTRKTPERKTPELDMKETARIEKEIKEKKERSPVKATDDEVNSTCEALTPQTPLTETLTPPRAPPAVATGASSDDDLELILGDIDGILSDDDDTGRFKDKPNKTEPPKTKPVTDLRSKLPPKHADTKPQRQKIVFEVKEDRARQEKTPPRRALVSSTKTDDSDTEKKSLKTKPKAELSNKSRQRITFVNKEKELEKEKEKDKSAPFSNRRVILQRKATKEKVVLSRGEADRSQPNPGIFSRAMRTAIGDKNKMAARRDEPQIEYESDSASDEEKLLDEEIGNVAEVDNLPHGMTDTRLRTLAGNEVQSLILDKQDRSAKITFKTTLAAENFKKKFNNKMVAASRLTVTLR